MARVFQGKEDSEDKQFAIVVSRFNEPVSKRLLEGALSAFQAAKLPDSAVTVCWVPGAFEIPLIAQQLAASEEFDGIVCLGAVIRGETPHFDFICTEAARGIADMSREFEIPVLFGVLTCETLEQAMERSGGKHGNKGTESARGAMEMADLLSQLDDEL